MTTNTDAVRVLRDKLEKLEGGAINVAENAKLRGDSYDDGYANAMAECARTALAATEPAERAASQPAGEVQRYSIDAKGLPYLDPEGVWVPYASPVSASVPEAITLKAIRSAVLAVNCDPSLDKGRQHAFLTAVHACAAAVGRFKDAAHVPEAHPDDIAVDRFADALKQEMAEQRAKGRGGWDDPAQCHTQDLAASMVRQIDNGELIKASAYAMMLFNRNAWPADLVGAMSLHFMDTKRKTAPEAKAEHLHKVKTDCDDCGASGVIGNWSADHEYTEDICALCNGSGAMEILVRDAPAVKHEASELPPLPDLPHQLEEVMGYWVCEDCGGHGVVGELQSMGHFQPPEATMCGSCEGAGREKITVYVEEQMRAYVLADRAARQAPSIAVPAGSIGDENEFCDLITDLTCAEEELAHQRPAAFNALVAYIDARSHVAAAPDCTEPDRAACPRHCQDFCNKHEEAKADARDAALEEAAEFCEADYRTENGWGITGADSRCAAGIRALKSEGGAA